jgi:hypothetical protein
MNGALQGMHRFTVSENAQDLPSEARLREVIAQVAGQHQFTQRDPGTVQGLTTGRAAISTQGHGRRTPSGMNGCRQANVLVPITRNRFQRKRRSDNRREPIGYVYALGDEQLLVFELTQSRVEIQTERLGQTGGKVRMPFGVDGDRFDLRAR